MNARRYWNRTSVETRVFLSGQTRFNDSDEFLSWLNGRLLDMGAQGLSLRNLLWWASIRCYES